MHRQAIAIQNWIWPLLIPCAICLLLYNISFWTWPEAHFCGTWADPTLHSSFLGSYLPSGPYLETRGNPIEKVKEPWKNRANPVWPVKINPKAIKVTINDFVIFFIYILITSFWFLTSTFNQQLPCQLFSIGMSSLWYGNEKVGGGFWNIRNLTKF